jgi:hypothetical protein
MESCESLTTHRRVFDGGAPNSLAANEVTLVFIVDDNVWEFDPYTVKEYCLDNAAKKADVLSREMLTAIADESGRFFDRN